MSHAHRYQSAVSTSHAAEIWLTNLSEVTAELRDYYRELLTSQERERLGRIHTHHGDMPDQYLVSRALCRTVLSHYAEVPSGAWVFDTNSYGKPHVTQPVWARDLKFNISHTDGIVACAVSRNFELGLDIENTQRDLDHWIVARAAFAPSEVVAMRSMPKHQQRQYFYTVWTLKEAYIKAKGKGLLLPLDSFWFDLHDGIARMNYSEGFVDEPIPCQFSRFDPTPEHKMAIAVIGQADQDFTVGINWVVPFS
jgi:4'-phosphopantetheinyl transferase